MNKPLELLRFGEIPIRPDEVDGLVGNPLLINSALQWKMNNSLSKGINLTISSHIFEK